MAVLGYLAKLKRGLGQAFGAHFLHDFSLKCSLFDSLSMGKVSVSHLISYSRFLKGYQLVKNKNLIKNSGHKLWDFIVVMSATLSKTLSEFSSL